MDKDLIGILVFSFLQKKHIHEYVQKAIETGVISSKARREVVQVLRTLISQYTKYPTFDQYTIICQKLVEKFPNLRDPVASNGFVSNSYLKINVCIDYVHL